MESSSTASQSGSRREATRQKLYEAAVTLIAEQGFSATTVDEIAERAGVAKGTVYYNFASKSVLFEELLRHGVGLLTASLRQAAERTAREGRGRVDALDAMIRAGLVFIDRYPAFTQLYVAELWRTNRAWQSTLLVVRQEAVAVVEGVLREGVASGEFSEDIDVPLTAAALVGMVLVAALDWKAFQPERSLDDVHAALSRLLQGRRERPGLSGRGGAAEAERAGKGAAGAGRRAGTGGARRTPVRGGRVPRGPPSDRRLLLLPRTSPRRDPRHRSSLRAPPCLAPAGPGRRKERIAGPAPFRRPVPPVPEPCPSPCLHSLVHAGRGPSARVLICRTRYGYSVLRTRPHGAAPPTGHLDVRSGAQPSHGGAGGGG
ncbi:Transcriptional regulator, TetR family [Streptomyces lividans 1326]|uniref:Transcriptional regulator, TetR family n=1 Tax=Streptomyces lividans 1326 TaxID=1200984 RepID=A0A7U9HAK1_STRLI|nr:Transcriptional regulator, TetR family [Streptomyces lividans 1326]